MKLEKTCDLQSPIFIVGVGRSGTSLLQSMLASHSDLSFLPETAFIRNYIAVNKLKTIIHTKGVSSALDIVSNDKTLSRVEFDFSKCLSASLQNIDLECYKKMQINAMDSTGKSRYGDKDPRLIEFLPVVKQSFPEAFVVNIIRDPRDVLSSKKKAAWSAGRSTMFYAFANRVQLRLARKLGSKLFGKRYIEIVYEDLIKEPEAQLKTLCNKLDLIYENSLLDFGKQAKKLVSKAEESWKKETLGPLLSNNVDKWKQQLNDREVALTELSCVDALEIGNYKNSNAIKKLSITTKVGVYLSHGIIVLLTPMYMAFRYFSQKRS